MKLLTRIVLLVLLVALCRWQSDETLHRILLWQVATRTSMRAEVESVHLDTANERLEIGQLRLLDPDRNNREVLSIGSISTNATFADLLRKRYHIHEGTVSDIRLRIGEEPEEGLEAGTFSPDAFWRALNGDIGKTEKQGDQEEGDAKNAVAADATVAVLTLLSGKDTDAALRDLLGRFDSIDVSRKLKERWPREAANFRAKAATIDTHIKQLGLLIDNVDRSTDRELQVRQILQQLARIEEEILDVQSGLEQLRSEGQQDYQALQAAVHADNARLKSLEVPKVDPQTLSDRLLGEPIREEFECLQTWADWTRSLIEPETVPQQRSLEERLGIRIPPRRRGTDVKLPGLDGRPDLLIDRLHLDGELLFGPLSVYFVGRIGDLAYPLDAGTTAAVAQFRFSGREKPDTPILTEEVQATLLTPEAQMALRPEIAPDIFATLIMDRTNGKMSDRLVVRCPVYRLPEQVLGDPEELAIAVSLGFATFDGVIEFHGDTAREDVPDAKNLAELAEDENGDANGGTATFRVGDRIDGEVRLVQHNVSMRPILPASLEGSVAAELLVSTLSEVRTLTTRVLVSGTRQAPVYTIRSNLGEQLAASLEKGLERQWGQTRKTLEETLSREIADGAASITTVTQELAPALLKELSEQQSGFDKHLASNATVGALLQNQLSQLSEKDRARVDRALQSPVLQGLLKESGSGERLPQELEKAIPGVLDRLLPR